MKKKKGHTLVEVIVAIVLYAFSLAAILGVMLQGVTMSKMAELTYTASTIAKNRIERLKNLSVSALDLAAETNTPIDQYGSPDPNGIYMRTTTVSTVAGYANVRQVIVSVYYVWRGTASSPRTVTTVIYTGG